MGNSEDIVVPSVKRDVVGNPVGFYAYGNCNRPLGLWVEPNYDRAGKFGECKPEYRAVDVKKFKPAVGKVNVRDV